MTNEEYRACVDAMTNAHVRSVEEVIMELANVLRPLGIRFTIQDRFDTIIIDTGQMTLPPETRTALSDTVTRLCPGGLGKAVVCICDVPGATFWR